jgi:hypothetical protein
VLKFDKMQLSARDTVSNPSDLADIFFTLMETNAKEISTNCTAYSCRIAEVTVPYSQILLFCSFNCITEGLGCGFYQFLIWSS